MEVYVLHVQLDEVNVLEYRYQLPAQSFDTIIADARLHQREGKHVILFREQTNDFRTQTGGGWVILERVLTFT